MERLDRDRYRLSSGRELSANHGLIGIARSDDYESFLGFEIGEGYDGHLWLDPARHEDGDGWTPEERAELADFMIEQWQAFKRGAV